MLVAHTSFVACFAVLGCYVRIVLSDATPPTFTTYLTSQLVGSFVIGVVSPLKPKLRHWDPVVVGVATGFWYVRLASYIILPPPR